MTKTSCLSLCSPDGEGNENSSSGYVNATRSVASGSLISPSVPADGFGGPAPVRNQCFQPCSLAGAVPASRHKNSLQNPVAFRLSYTGSPLPSVARARRYVCVASPRYFAVSLMFRHPVGGATAVTPSRNDPTLKPHVISPFALGPMVNSLLFLYPSSTGDRTMPPSSQQSLSFPNAARIHPTSARRPLFLALLLAFRTPLVMFRIASATISFFLANCSP
mmetsp:Transcript_129/g.515  ORF Transcript_129/g.515 Transcript_129/m.515 type:complete len:220 (+) Transcript_129:1589-2248(+)